MCFVHCLPLLPAAEYMIQKSKARIPLIYKMPDYFILNKYVFGMKKKFILSEARIYKFRLILNSRTVNEKELAEEMSLLVCERGKKKFITKKNLNK